MAYGYYCNKKRVHRLLQEMGYRSRACKRKSGAAAGKNTLPVGPNLLRRNFSTSEPNRVWVSDITQICCHEGWQYLCVIIDLYSRRVVAWATSYMNSQELVMSALKKAWKKRKPEGEKLLFHSDQGVQYRAYQVLRWLVKRGVTVSMSRKGNCWDNACSESFFAQLKNEWFSNLEILNRREMTVQCQFYIDSYYNIIRRHGTLNGQSPIEYECQN